MIGQSGTLPIPDAETHHLRVASDEIDLLQLPLQAAALVIGGIDAGQGTRGAQFFDDDWAGCARWGRVWR